MVLAAIDTGSNAVRMAIGDTSKNFHSQVNEVSRIPIRLGKDVFHSGFIKTKTATQLIAAFQQFKKIMNENRVVHYTAVATSAFREAKNGLTLIKEIFRSSQIQLQIIDGLEEARLVHLAIMKYSNEPYLDALILDIGGGSVETIFSQQGKISLIESLRMGTVRLLENFDPDRQFDQLHTKIHQTVTQFYQKTISSSVFLEGEKQKWDHQTSFKKFMVTGGNARCLGRLAARIFQLSSAFSMSLKELESLLALLHSMRTKQRREELNLKPDRADVIVPAALIIYEFMKVFGYKNLQISPVGLKNGLLYDLELKNKN